MYRNRNRDADQQQDAGGQGAWGAGAGQDGVIMTPDGFVKQAASALATEAKMAFLKKVYGWFFLAVLAASGVAAVMFQVIASNPRAASLIFGNWLIVLAAFMILTFVANRMMMSAGTAKFGLFMLAGVWGLMFSPLIYVAVMVSGMNGGDPFMLLYQGVGLTVVTFGSLTAYVFITRQDFSFMRGALVVGTVVLFGIIIISAFSPAATPAMTLGILGFGVLLGAGYTLYDTSQIMLKCGEGDEIMAAGMLLGDFAFMLWYILQILIHFAGAADG